jgi:hypothetical protein
MLVKSAYKERIVVKQNQALAVLWIKGLLGWVLGGVIRI